MRGRESQRESVVHIEGLSFPESLRWHDGALWFTDLSTQRVMRAGGDGHVQTVAELPDIPSALGWTPDGRLLIVQAISRQLLRMDDSTLAVVADMSAHVTYRCNDMIVDRRGRVYVGNMGFDLGDPEAVPQPGSILLVTPNGDVRIVADELAFPNGMAITPDGQTLIVAESYAARLTAFDITPDGSLVHPRTWASFAPSTTAGAEEVTPDGTRWTPKAHCGRLCPARGCPPCAGGRRDHRAHPAAADLRAGARAALVHRHHREADPARPGRSVASGPSIGGAGRRPAIGRCRLLRASAMPRGSLRGFSCCNLNSKPSPSLGSTIATEQGLVFYRLLGN